MTKKRGPGPLSKPRMNNNIPIMATIDRPFNKKLVVIVIEPRSMMLKANKKMVLRDMRSTMAMKMNTVNIFHKPTTNTWTSKG